MKRLSLALSLCILTCGTTSLRAQEIPNPVDPVPPRQLDPLPIEPFPTTPPPLQTPPSVPIPADPSLEEPEKICIDRFEVKAEHPIFTEDEIGVAIRQAIGRNPGEPFGCLNSFEQLRQARAAVTQLYFDRGYITSFAYLPEQDIEVEGGIVTLQVVEGTLEEIQVVGHRRLQPNYIRSRLKLATGQPLNRDRLLEALQQLRLNPLIENISAELSQGSRSDRSLLTVRIAEARSFNIQATLDNNRSPSVGSFRRSVEVREDNLLGLGDGLSLTYRNTDGSHELDARYRFPLNPRNGVLELRYRTGKSEVIEEPFDPLDIEANYRSYDLTWRQPIVQQVDLDAGRFEELTLGLTAQRQESNTSLLGVDFPLSTGANEDGETRVSAVRFFQEWTQRDAREVLAARSEFSLGVGAFDATVNSEPPDSRFFAWRGQVQWLRLLGSPRSNPRKRPALLVRSDVQLASRALLPLEQFSLGGQASVRGYRQDARLGDNGILGSIELRWPVWQLEDGVLFLVPFIDAGAIWNASNRQNPDSNVLAGAGFGLLWQQSDRFRARLDWGIPLIDLDSEKRTWQENGLYFTVEYNFF